MQEAARLAPKYDKIMCFELNDFLFEPGLSHHVYF